MTTKSYKQVVEDVQGLSYYPSLLKQELQQIATSPYWSEDYKKQLAERVRAQRTEDARQDAKRTWERAQRRVERTAQQLEAARRAADEGLDWTRIQVQAAEFGAQLRNPPPGKTQVQVLNALIQRASATPEGRRALRLASSDILASGDTALEASAARAALRQWQEEAEQPIRTAELEAQHAQAGVDEVRSAILRTEAEVTGQRQSSWRISDWQKTVLGEDAYSLGRIVMNDDTAAYMGQPVPSQAKPSGIE